MYIWIGCKLPEKFEQEIRQRCLSIGAQYKLDTAGFSLPQHISLKISFDAGERYKEILDKLCAMLEKEKRFCVTPKGIQQQGNILWIPFRESGILRSLHNRLDDFLYRDFGIAQHPFDKAFQFHSTLFFGERESITQAEAMLMDYPLPDQLQIDTCLLGISESGKSGTYRVVREICLL